MTSVSVWVITIVILLAVLALLVVIIAAYGYFTHNATKPSTTAFIVPSQSVKW